MKRPALRVEDVAAAAAAVVATTTTTTTGASLIQAFPWGSERAELMQTMIAKDALRAGVSTLASASS